MNKVFLIWIVLFSFSAIFVDTAKILSIFNIPSKSHYLYGVALLKELAARGHEITSVNLYPQEKPLKNFRDVFIEENLFITQRLIPDGKGGEHEDPAEMVLKLLDVVKDQCVNLMNNKQFKKVLEKDKFDLIILEVIWNEALSGLGEYFNAPMIGISTFGTDVGLDDIVGNPSPNSIVPNLHYNYTADMNFFERVHNFIGNAKARFVINWKGRPEQKALYEKYFPNAKLSFDQARKNYSLLILNHHSSLLYTRPILPNVIEAIGLHIPNSIPALPKDLQSFLDNSPEGIIYMSMGTNIKSSKLPINKRHMFLNVFRKLKHKVLWKYENDIPNKPDNVHIITWAPQQAILNHTNVKVFITHGGLLSTTEAVHFAKPILGIPFFWDQHRNLRSAQKKGMCITYYFPTLNEEQLEYGLTELWNNTKYTKKAIEASNLYHDQPMTPMDNAVYWVEYVLRHKGAYHLRNTGVDLNILQYYSVDVISFLLAIFAFFSFIFVYILKSVFRKWKGTTKSLKIK